MDLSFWRYLLSQVPSVSSVPSSKYIFDVLPPELWSQILLCCDLESCCALYCLSFFRNLISSRHFQTLYIKFHDISSFNNHHGLYYTKNGVKEGPGVEFCSLPHSKFSLGIYHEGLRTAIWKNTAINGRVSEECAYSRGVRHGRCRSFHPEGGLKSDGYFIDGEPSGLWRYFARDSDRYRLYPQSIQSRTDGRSSPICEIRVLPGGNRRYFVAYYPSGAVRERGELAGTWNGESWKYTDEEKDGPWEAFWEDGRLLFRCLFVHGKRHGTMVYRRRPSDVLVRKEYIEGKELGWKAHVDRAFKELSLLLGHSLSWLNDYFVL